jgi:D-glucosaminate-6-phosphate ammonia-lyase
MKRRHVIKGLALLPVTGSILPEVNSHTLIDHQFGLQKDKLPATRNSFMEKNIYRDFGIEPVINCLGTYTIIGGSIKLPEVKQAMEAASHNFAQMDEVADGIGKRLAELTGAEWGVVSAGCAAGLKLVTAAAVSGGDPEKLIRIPHIEDFPKNEVIMPLSSRNYYDHAIRNIGVKVINVSNLEELENSINPKTALIYMVNGDASWTGAAMSLENVSQIAKAKKVPILFDAANEILTFPPVHLKRGATVVAHSGGKSICGPQSCGMLLGDKKLLLAAWQASSPHHGPCRDNKVDRDEMFGMVAAVEFWKKNNLDETKKRWSDYVNYINNRVSGVSSVKTLFHDPSILSKLSFVAPEAVISWDPDVLNITGQELADELSRTKPRVAVASGGGRWRDPNINGISVNTFAIQPGEEKIVADRIYEVLTAKRNTRNKQLIAPVSNMSGNWDVQVDFYNSESMHKLFIEQDGNWVKGNHKSSYFLNNLTGTIEGDKVKLRSMVEIPGDTIIYTFTGTITGNTISGNLFMGEYRSASFTAVKDTKPVIKKQIFVPSGAPLAS